MTMMTIEEIEAFDLRKAAIHECGHANVTRHCGMGGSPAIWHNDTDNFLKEKLWIGTTHYKESASTPLKLRRVAIAGFLAEEISGFDSISDCDESTLTERLESSFGDCFNDSEGWSRSDWEGAEGWTSADIHAVYLSLTRNWKELLEEAATLINVASKSGSAICNSPEEFHDNLSKVYNGNQPELNAVLDQSQNAERSALSRTPLAPKLVVPSKTRLQLTVIDRAKKEQLARNILDVVCKAMSVAHIASLGGPYKVERIKCLSQSYYLLIDKANTLITTIHENQQDFFSTQTIEWQDSKSGRAYLRWMEKWGIKLPSELPESWHGEGFELIAMGMLQNLPAEPSE